MRREVIKWLVGSLDCVYLVIEIFGSLVLKWYKGYMKNLLVLVFFFVIDFCICI